MGGDHGTGSEHGGRSRRLRARLARGEPGTGRRVARPPCARPNRAERETVALLQSRLLARSRDPRPTCARASPPRRALGELGDPRFERAAGPHGEYLLPPLVDIEAGTYAIGSDEGLNDERSAGPRSDARRLRHRALPGDQRRVAAASWTPAATRTSAGGTPRRQDAGSAARERPRVPSSSSEIFGELVRDNPAQIQRLAHRRAE